MWYGISHKRKSDYSSLGKKRECGRENRGQ
jgi:hypothetical protein